MSKQRRWTQEDIDRVSKVTGGNEKVGRYGKNKRCVHGDGTKFDSRLEMNRYSELLLLKRAGEITELKVHPRYPLYGMNGKLMMRSNRYPNGRQMVYVADFSYNVHAVIDGEPATKPVIEDVKMQSGHRTEVYKIKRALMDAMGCPITEV